MFCFHILSFFAIWRQSYEYFLGKPQTPSILMCFYGVEREKVSGASSFADFETGFADSETR